MGVKPNKKGSITTVMLLLFFANGSFARWNCASDTLILDGEIIEVVVDDQSAVRDSLEDLGRDDLRKASRNKNNNQFGMHLGVVYNFTKATNNIEEAQFLPDYMNFNAFSAVGLDAQMNYRRQFGELPLFGSSVIWGIEVGFGLQQVSWKSLGMNPEQINQDSLIGFRREGDQLFLDYITIFDEPFPVFELDTIQVELTEQKFVVNSAVLRIGPVFEWELTPSTRWSLSFGVNYRAQFQNVKTNDQFWIEDAGRLRIQPAQQLAMKSYVLSPFTQMGWTKALKNDMHWGCGVSAVGPAGLINDNSDLQWSNWQLMAYLRWSKSF